MLKHLLRGGRDIKGDSWVATLGGSSSNDSVYGSSVAIGPDDSVYVCGFVSSTSSTSAPDGFIAKFDSSGTLQWQKTLVGKYQEKSFSVAVGPDGSVYVCVYQYDPHGAVADLMVVKFDSSGEIQFQKALGRSKSVYGQSVAIGLDGSVYVCAYMYSMEKNNLFDHLIAKLDSSGALQWQKQLHDPSQFAESSTYQHVSVAIGPDGSVYVGGKIRHSTPNSTYSKILIAKFDSSGVLQWQKTLYGGKWEDGTSLAVGPDGSVYVGGSTQLSSGRYDILIAKLNSSGSIQWQKTIGEGYNDESFSVAVGPDGSVYVCGEIGDKYVPKYDCLIVKFNPSGTLQWQKNCDYIYDSSLAIGPDDSVYICGRSSSNLRLARITDADIKKSTAVCGHFKLQDVSVPTSNSYLRSETASLSVSNAGLSVSTASLTIADANYISKKYEGE